MPNATRSRCDSPDKTCTEPGCHKPLRARGLCNPHYKQQHSMYRIYTRTCESCGATWQTQRADGKYCTDSCKAYAYLSATSCAIPWTHPIWSSPVPADHPARRPRSTPAPHVTKTCDWCGKGYDRTTRHHTVFCAPDCRRRAKLARRKGREADGHTYTWSHVMRLLLLLDGRCTYCEQTIDGPPDPDHVVPLSRGGSNGNGNVVPSCRPCNSDKRDLLLREWAADRQQRGKPPVRTTLDPTHPAFASLIPDALTSGMTQAHTG